MSNPSVLYLKFALIMWGSFCCCCCCKNGSSSSSSGTKDDEKSVVIYEATLISLPPSIEDPPSSSPTFESFSSIGFDPSLSIASESIAEVSEASESESSEKSENTVIFNAFNDDVGTAAELIFQYQNIDRDYYNSEVHQSSRESGKLCSETTMYRETYPFVFSTVVARKIHLPFRHSFVSSRL